jgi:Thoeris protein ThsB, TIR-like domain
MFRVQSDYHDAMKVFLSYQMEDGPFREDFSRNVADIEPTVIFRDYPKMSRFDREWRQRCSELIRECVGTVVLVGHTTYQSQPVAWEIAETKRQSLPAIGVILRGIGQASIPRGLGHGDVVPVGDIDAVVSHIRSWSA